MNGKSRFQTVLPVMIVMLLLAACKAQPTPTPVPPTLTPAPTVDVAAVQTAAAATVVARVAAEATATAAAIPTPSATPLPTNTPQPTDTLLPTKTPLPTDTPLPTATATPTPKPKPIKTPTPAVILDLAGMRYESWGNPQQGCASFDDRNVVRKFNLEITLTNTTDQAIQDWYPDFYSNGGRLLLTCFYVYSAEGFPTVPPGEKRTDTFASFCNRDEHVEEMKMTVLEKEYRRCFSPEGALVPCQ
jgi:hypothetical protein